MCQRNVFGRWFLVQLVFDAEDGSDTFLRNVVLHTDYRHYIPEDGNIYKVPVYFVIWKWILDK
jgi:hypothetical protein